MATWADLADCTDPVVVVEEAQLRQADIRLAALLRNIGVGADQEAGISDDGRELLRSAAVSLATADAAMASLQSGQQDDVMRAKHALYFGLARQWMQSVNRESLGLAATGSGAAGYGSISVTRA